MDEEEKEELLEEQLDYLKAVLQERMAKSPRAMSDAIAIVILKFAEKRYAAFIEGLENEFDKHDRLNLFNAHVEHLSHFWFNAETDKACEMAYEILEEFEIQEKIRKRRLKRGMAFAKK